MRFSEKKVMREKEKGLKWINRKEGGREGEWMAG